MNKKTKKLDGKYTADELRTIADLMDNPELSELDHYLEQVVGVRI